MTIKVGCDEFCSNCMDWQEYDEEGRCKVCKKIIKKIHTIKEKSGYDSYKSETPILDDDDIGDIDY